LFPKASKLVLLIKLIVIIPSQEDSFLYKPEMKSIKRIGESGDPWGTPDGIGKGIDVLLLKRSCAIRVLRKL
jgi:hypothetical protein